MIATGKTSTCTKHNARGETSFPINAKAYKFDWIENQTIEFIVWKELQSHNGWMRGDYQEETIRRTNRTEHHFNWKLFIDDDEHTKLQTEQRRQSNQCEMVNYSKKELIQRSNL